MPFQYNRGYGTMEHKTERQIGIVMGGVEK